MPVQRHGAVEEQPACGLAASTAQFRLASATRSSRLWLFDGLGSWVPAHRILGLIWLSRIDVPRTTCQTVKVGTSGRTFLPSACAADIVGPADRDLRWTAHRRTGPKCTRRTCQEPEGDMITWLFLASSLVAGPATAQVIAQPSPHS